MTPLSEILFKVHPPLPCLKEDCYLGDAALCHAAKAGPHPGQVSNSLDDQHGETHTTISTHSVTLLVKILGVAAENPRRPNTTCKLHQDSRQQGCSQLSCCEAAMLTNLRTSSKTCTCMCSIADDKLISFAMLARC